MDVNLAGSIQKVLQMEITDMFQTVILVQILVSSTDLHT